MIFSQFTLLQTTNMSYYNKTTNIAALSNQEAKWDDTITYSNGKVIVIKKGDDTGNCYAHAASSAYVNAVSRICGEKKVDLEEAINYVTKKYGMNGGQVYKSIQYLESIYKKGIKCDRLQHGKLPEVSDIFKYSVVVSFCTSAQGWKDFEYGTMLKTPYDIKTPWKDNNGNIGRHACLIESYDFENKCVRLKNSWGDGRVNVRFSSFCNFQCIIVYYTLSSINIINKYIPDMINCYDNDYIDKIKVTKYMTHNTAQHEANYFSVRMNKPKISNLNGTVYRYKSVPLQKWINQKLKDNA